MPDPALGLGADRDRLAELADQVLPFPDAQIVEELATAHPSEGAGRELLLLGAQVVPQRQPVCGSERTPIGLASIDGVLERVGGENDACELAMIIDR